MSLIESNVAAVLEPGDSFPHPSFPLQLQNQSFFFLFRPIPPWLVPLCPFFIIPLPLLLCSPKEILRVACFGSPIIHFFWVPCYQGGRTECHKTEHILEKIRDTHFWWPTSSCSPRELPLPRVAFGPTLYPAEQNPHPLLGLGAYLTLSKVKTSKQMPALPHAG